MKRKILYISLTLVITVLSLNINFKNENNQIVFDISTKKVNSQTTCIQCRTSNSECFRIQAGPLGPFTIFDGVKEICPTHE
jgi:hypothetical protein